MKPRIAVVDLLFANPPKGGAGVDLLETFTRLTQYETAVFYPLLDGSWPRGLAVEPIDGLELHPVELDSLDRSGTITAFVAALQGWQPDLVFVADGWTLKPYLAAAFNERWPSVLRLYAYEMLCPRNNERWLHTHACDNWLLDDAPRCLSCAKEYAEIVRERAGRDNPLIAEGVSAGIQCGDYGDAVTRALSCDAVIVYNDYLKQYLNSKGHQDVHVVPGGVSLEQLPTRQEQAGTFQIFVYGRMDDPAKGADVAVGAGRLLQEKGIDFQMAITRQPKCELPWLEETGWLPREEALGRLSEADLCLLPSVWEEAFGMTGIEALGMGIPLIASDVAGPREYVDHSSTGLLAVPGDAADLAAKIEMVIQDSDLRRTLSRNGQRIVSERFTWDHAAAATDNVIQSVLSMEGV